MDISIVIPVYNGEKYIERCIRSLLGQDYPSCAYEILVVDNNSSDNTCRLVERHPRVSLLKESEQGSYAARNLGIAHAKGEVIAFTDPDCSPLPDWLSQIAGSLAEDRRQIVLGKREYISPSMGLSLLADYEECMADYVFTSDRPEIYFGYTNNMAVRASLFETLGRFMTLRRGADTVFVRGAVDTLGCDIVSFCPKMRVRHLEITGVRDFYKKRFIYGRSNERNHALGSATPLKHADRLAIFQSMVRGQPTPVGKAAGLLTLLTGGLLFYELGRLSARWRWSAANGEERTHRTPVLRTRDHS